MTHAINLTKKAFVWTVVALTALYSLFPALSVYAVDACPSFDVEDVGMMFKAPNAPAVYALTADANDMLKYNVVYNHVAKSWGGLMEDVMELTSNCFPGDIGGALPHRPGTVVQETTKNKVYLVAAAADGGVELRHIGSPEVAVAAVGADWESRIVGVSPFVWLSVGYHNMVGAEMGVAELTEGSLVLNDDAVWSVMGGELVPVVDASEDARAMALPVAQELVDAASVSEAEVAGEELFYDSVYYVDAVYEVAEEEVVADDEAAEEEAADEEAADEAEEEVPAEDAGDLRVSLHANSPVAKNIPAKATNVEFTRFVVEAVGGDVTLNNVSLKRMGLSNANDLDSVYLYDGDTRLRNGRTVSSETDLVIFNNLGLRLNEGDTMTLRVVADLHDTNAVSGDLIAFSVVKLNDMEVNVAGATLSVANTAVSAVTIDNSGTTGSFTVGETQAEVAKGQINAGSATDDVLVKRLVLTNIGSLANEDLENLTLKISGETKAMTPAMEGDKAIFVFDEPYRLREGNTRLFYVYADVVGGRDAETVKFYVDEKSDVFIEDANYGFGVDLTNSWASTDQTYTAEGGEITLADNGPQAGNVARGVDNVHLLDYTFTSDNDVTVRNTRVTIFIEEADGTATTSAAVHADVTDISVIDRVTGQTLAGPLAASSNGTVEGDGRYYDFSDNYDVGSGDARQMAVVVDLAEDFGSNYNVYAKVDYSQDNAVRYEGVSSQYVSSNDIVPSSITGDEQTVTAATLTVEAAGVPGDDTAVKGQEEVEALGLILTPSNAEDIRITNMKLRVYADDDAVAFDNGEGDLAANTIVSSVELWEDGGDEALAEENLSNLSGTIGADGGYYYVQFDNLNYVVPKATDKKLLVKLNLRSEDLDAEPSYLVVDIHPKNDMDVEVYDPNGTNDGGTVTENSNALVNNDADLANVIDVAVYNSGSVTIEVDSSDTPDADIVVASGESVVFSRYRMKGDRESLSLIGAGITLSSADYNENIERVELVYKNAAGETVTKSGNLGQGATTLVFDEDQLNMHIPKDRWGYLTIKAVLNTVEGGASSSDTGFKLGLTKYVADNNFDVATGALANSFIVRGASGRLFGYTNSNSLASNFDQTGINAMTQRKTKVSVAALNAAVKDPHGAAQDNVAVFRFSSLSEVNSQELSTLNSITMTLSGNLVSDSNTGTSVVSFYDGGTFDAANLMGTGSFAFSTATRSASATVTLSSDNEFSTTKDVFVVLDTTANHFSETDANTEKLTAQITNFSYNDGADATVAPVTGMPVSAATINY